MTVADREIDPGTEHVAPRPQETVERGLSAAEADASHARQVERALAVLGRHRSGLHDVATRHDDYLAEPD